MGHLDQDQAYRNSYLHPPRSRATSSASSVNSLFSHPPRVDSPSSLHSDASQLATTSQDNHLSSYTSAPASRSATSFPSAQSYLPSPPVLRNSVRSYWSGKVHLQQPPTFRVDPAPDDPPSHRPTTNSNTTNMSAVAVHYEPHFGGPRSAFTWPSLEHGDLLGHDLGSISHGSDASLTPPSTSRSITSSPPRSILTPEQRELKRQRDQARRDSKTAVRARRAMSTASYASQSPPPVTMAEFSAASTMPIYTTSPSQISLLAEPVTTVPGSGYIPSYSNSPLPDQGMFSSPFPTMPSSGYMGLEYSSGFPPPPSSHNIHHNYNSRQSSMPESSLIYSMPPVLPSGGSSGQEAGHVRVVQSRPKPQCWDHGCNGRQFSTFSNLLRHQREKSGQAAKAVCHKCGAEFTRTTARNGHLLHDKCKQRRNS